MRHPALISMAALIIVSTLAARGSPKAPALLLMIVREEVKPGRGAANMFTESTCTKAKSNNHSQTFRQNWSGYDNPG